MFAQRSLAFLIEECIRVIMDLEDVDSILISLGAPHASEDAASIAERIRLRHQRHALCARLLDSLDLQSTLEVARFEGNAVNVEAGSAQAALAVAYTLCVVV